MEKNIFEKVENLFDQDDVQEHLKIYTNEKFNVEPNHQLLSNIQFNESPEKWELFFTRLIPFFEMGLFIKNDSVLKLFLNGHTADIPILKLIFKLPTSPYFNILRTPAVPLLRELKLENLIQSQKACGLLIRLDQNEYIVLFTEVADPWLRLRCENLQKSLIQHDYY